MNVCFDIDGTITERPEFFSLLSRAVKKSGGKVFVLTSRTRSPEAMEATKLELSGYGIEYDDLNMLPDKAEAERTCPLKELDWYQKFIFQKVDYCKANQVDVYFDDETKVIDLFKRFLPEVQVFQVHPKGV